MMRDKLNKLYFRDKVVLITGASSGIGEALARKLGSYGAKLALGARRKNLLDRIAEDLSRSDANCLTVPCDVTDSSSLENFVRLTEQKWGRIDIVIANAGYAVTGRLEQLSGEDYRKQFEVNVFGVLETARLTYASLVRSRGHFCALGSVMSYISFAGSSPYAMSKYAVRALTEALFHEWAPQGIAVTLICPGLVESQIRQVDNRGHHHGQAKDPVPKWLVMPSSEAAAKILAAIRCRKREQQLTIHGRIGIFIKNHCPSLFHQIVKQLNVQSGRQKAKEASLQKH